MRDRTPSTLGLGTLFVPPSAVRRGRLAVESLALATAGRHLGCPCRWPCAHPPGPYAYRELLAEVLRVSPSSQRAYSNEISMKTSTN